MLTSSNWGSIWHLQRMLPPVNQSNNVIRSGWTSLKVVGHHRKGSESDDIIGSRRKSKVVESIKEGHMNRYYTIVKSELICVKGAGKSDMCERKRVPVQCACANQNACAVMNLKEKRSKTLRKREKKNSKAFV